ncbi:MAG: glycoside hydrolase family 65 protein, partial [Bacteroidales bacterium]|nr:glycoside hydrolase family 65 protein [Bacteroidales bacterium]
MSDKAFDSDVWDAWGLIYDDYDPLKEKSRESLLAVGNGYMGIRGAMEESSAGDNHYPGTYIAGVYNRLISRVAGKDIENEDLVNCPNSLSLSFKINQLNWLDIDDAIIVSIHRKLDFRTGILHREMIVEDHAGNRTRVISRRTASMHNTHLVAIEYCLEALNYSGNISLRSQLDGAIINDGVDRYRSLNQKHLEVIDQGGASGLVWLRVQTSQSKIEIAEAMKHSVSINGAVHAIDWRYHFENRRATAEFDLSLEQNQQLCVQKLVAVYTSKPDDVSHPLQHCKDDLGQDISFDDIIRQNKKAWKNIWDKIDIQIDGDIKSQSLIRLHLYHLMLTASPHNASIDAGIPARGLHGEAYRGHIFWDELYILPIYDLFLPDVARS